VRTMLGTMQANEISPENHIPYSNVPRYAVE